jgi:hypothetical protein
MTNFNGLADDLATAQHNVGTHVFKAMLITTIPGVGDATSNAYTEVTGTNYTAGGIDLEMTLGGTAPQAILQSAVDTLWSEDATGFTDAKAVVVRNTTTGKNVCFGDITADEGTTPVSSAAQDVDVNWANGTDVTTIG